MKFSNLSHHTRFNALDEDHNGFVDIDELKDDMATVLKGETRTPEELMAETDTNGDGHVK
jgi:Ca2+-binding EF-hand superfamily protein